MATAAKSRSRSKKAAASRGSLNDALAQAGWAEADTAVAEAVVEFDQLERAVAELKGSAPARARAEEALVLVGQALARVGRRRNLTRIGEVGATVRFVAKEHEFARAPASLPKYVTIVAE